MSQKKRRHNPLELVREPPAVEEPLDERLAVHHLTGELHDTLQAIISGCAFLAKDPAEMSDALIDDVDTEIDKMRDLFASVSLTTRVLARALIARALGRNPLTVGRFDEPEPSEAETETETALLDGLAHALLPQNLPAAARPSRTEQREAFEDAALLVKEVGLEEFDVSCDVAPVGDGTYELFAFQVSPESAHVELLEFLFDRAESIAEEEDELLAIERGASSWEFLRWSAAPPPGKMSVDDGTFARQVRELEYSLSDRPTVTLGTSLIAELAADEYFAELFPRQHRMAAALAASVVGAFECTALDGNRVTLRSIRDGSTYTVHEYLEPIDYSTGWVGAGRLIPFDSGLYLRSPGMVFTPARKLELARAAANDVGALERTLPPALAVEAFISTAMLGVDVPRTLKPMRSRADARELLAELQLMLADAEFELDATLQEFKAALTAQATAGSGGDSQAQTGAKRTTRRSSKRRR